MQDNNKERKRTRSTRTKKKNSKKIWVTVVSGVALILCVTIVFGIMRHTSIKTESNKDSNNVKQDDIVLTPKNNGFIDFNSKSRTYAVVIDNSSQARPQIGLSNSYITYEFIVEGGITRLLALFRDQKLDKIGPVRSARHYFLDYVLENDAILVHYGASSKAEVDIEALNINSINGITAGGKYFWREKGLVTPHDVVTSTNRIENFVLSHGYRNTSSSPLLLDYLRDSANLQKFTDKMVANKIKIYYSSYYTGYEYDAESKLYKRYSLGEKHMDASTKKQLTTKNIIIQKVKNYNLLGAYGGSGRQDLDNIGTGKGYYITEGFAIPINWTKNTRTGKTKYTTSSGEELMVSNGNTFMQIQPEASKTIIE